ncbi:AcrR family transcriptional regulator [Microbacterium sp. AK009]|uniref:TetR/AcrR family transcriptional regulator n=1 Tax=Microbacterium sp. AK009 TaxID=2723068 RepID=UPI0015CAF250|nr:TetR/AcrR family transcriptional regulator [Microbacterium sp. AK009]NYF18217.1 AcrR family transcriptional regulator [Microbacterium sp. AK009]
MAGAPLTYHQRVAGEKRSAIIAAASRLFARDGYGNTSLARIAEAADVSTATLFKQFPTKADLFEVIVADFWGRESAPPPLPSPADPGSGLEALGRQYTELLRRPGMVGLHRMVIAEAPRFPELARIQFDLGKEPFFERVHAYITAAAEQGALRVPNATIAATQFLGMISNVVFWPKLLLVEWDPAEDTVSEAVTGAVTMMLATYGARASVSSLR